MRSPVAIALSLLACGVSSGAQGPSEAAVEWLREVASGKATEQLGDETALSPETSPEDRKTITRRIRHLEDTLRPEDLRVVADKQDGDLAAVLVSQITNYDSSSVQVHAVGLVKSEDRWLPAPLPSSFDFTGLSLRPGFLPRLKSLEIWMLRNRADQLVRLKNDAFSVLFEEMKKVQHPHGLREASPEQLTSDFLAALANRDMPAVLTMLGGLESPRPAEFDEAFQIVSRILRRKEIAHPAWRLLAAPEAARAVVASEQGESDGQVNLIALDPAGNLNQRPHPRGMVLPFLRSEAGNWRIRLPQELLDPPARTNSPGREEEGGAPDPKQLDHFPGKLAASLGTKPEPNARAAAEAIIAALQAPSLTEICQRMNLSGDAEAGLDSLVRAGQLWQRAHVAHDPTAPILLSIHEEGDDACAVVQLFSARDPLRSNLETIFLHREKDEWLANPGFSGAAGLSHVTKPAVMSEWLGMERSAREADWAAGTLVRIGGIAADSAPTEDEARKVVDEWREATAAGNGARMLSLSACFDDEAGSARLLRNTGYELTNRQTGTILGVHRSGRWAAVSLRVPPANGDDSADTFPLVVVATTSAGPRVLPELDLFDPLTRGRNLLNRTVWERIATRLPDGARGELESIYEKHRTICAADRERHAKPSE